MTSEDFATSAGCKLPDAAEQFLSADMADLSAGLFADQPLRVVERFADKQVGVAAVARIPGQDLLQRFVEIDFLHFMAPRPGSLPSADGRCDTF